MFLSAVLEWRNTIGRPNYWRPSHCPKHSVHSVLACLLQEALPHLAHCVGVFLSSPLGQRLHHVHFFGGSSTTMPGWAGPVSSWIPASSFPSWYRNKRLLCRRFVFHWGFKSIHIYVCIQGTDIKHIAEDCHWPSPCHTLCAVCSQHLVCSIHASLRGIVF